MFTDQAAFDVRCEWGTHALRELAPSDVTVIVDVLSFSTCVEIALTNGAVILPYPLGHEGSAAYAKEHGAHLAGKRGSGAFSLSPDSLKKIPKGTRLVLPSPNGSHLTFHAQGPCVLAGCLRNARSVAEYAARMGRSVTVIPAGERWRGDRALRPAIEDLIGAGAIVAGLKGTLSPEAQAARAVFLQARADLLDALMRCASGRELAELGFPEDVRWAAELDVSTTVPVFRAPEYVRA